MYGFTDKVLLLFPKYDDYDAKPYGWKLKFANGLENLHKYLHTQGMDVHAFYTDDVARKHSSIIDRWLNPLSRADSYFASKHCNGMGEYMSLNMEQYPELYAEIARADMVDKDASEIDRFNMIIRHVNAATKEIMKGYKVIIHIQKRSRQQYHPKSKAGDGKLLVNVDCDSMTSTCLMSGTEADIVDVFDLSCANRAMYLWEV